MTSSRQVVTFARYTESSPAPRVASSSRKPGGREILALANLWRISLVKNGGPIHGGGEGGRRSDFRAARLSQDLSPLSPSTGEEICCEGNLKNYDFIHEPDPIYGRRKEARDDSIARIFLSSEEFHGNESRHPFPTIYLAP